MGTKGRFQERLEHRRSASHVGCTAENDPIRSIKLLHHLVVPIPALEHIFAQNLQELPRNARYLGNALQNSVGQCLRVSLPRLNTTAIVVIVGLRKETLSEDPERSIKPNPSDSREKTGESLADFARSSHRVCADPPSHFSGRLISGIS